MAERYEVVIVGGGPVGMALAVDLAQRDIRCAVIERHHDVVKIPKGQNLQHRTLEHFYFWNCVDELRAARVLPDGYPIGGLTAYGNLMSDYWYAPDFMGGVNSFFFQQNERLPQYRTEEVLRERLKDLPQATIRFDVEVNKVEQSEDGVRISAASMEWPYEEEVFEGSYVVGCDGARSLVREQHGIERHGRNFDQRMALAVFASEDLNEALNRFPERTTYRVMDPAYHGAWLFFGRVGIGEWFFHGPVPRETTQQDTELVLALMRQAAGFDFTCEFQHLGFWELQVAVADQYRKGRAFIAGDACHTHPPYGGLGLNNGLEDVANLGWKLAATLRGWGGEVLLDSYHEERQPVFVETGEDVIARGIDLEAEWLESHRPVDGLAEFEEEWGKRLSGDQAPRWYEPHYDGSPVVVDALGPTGVHGQHELAAHAGHHLSPQPLSSGRNVYEELGLGFALIALDTSDDAVAEFAAAAERLGIELRVLRDSFAGGREQYGAHLVLVRPDQFVAWCGESAAGRSEEILARSTGRS